MGMTVSALLSMPDSGASFEMFARQHFSNHWHVDLAERSVLVSGMVPKKFDLVSRDERYIGDAKWYRNISVPAAKWSTISEYVWQLQRSTAEKVFLVFGNDIEIPQRYLKRFGPLVAPVEFYFLDRTGHLRLL